MSGDPFAPPEADLAVPTSRTPVEPHQLADRGRRLAGAVIDGALYALACIPGAMLVAATGDAGDGNELASMSTLFLPSFLLYVFQMYRVVTRGQTIAKTWLSMRIVRGNGAAVTFLHGVVLRSWVPILANLVPLFGSVIGLADAVCIFGERHQCLHDMVADTQVIDVSFTEFAQA